MVDEPTATGEARGAASERVRLRRHPERGHYDQAVIHPILDEGVVCHVGFSDGHGPVVLPTAYVRVGDHLYLHGATGNAALRALSSGAPVCVTVTLLDGLVLARSAFHHSVNYRSVVILATAVEVTDAGEKRTALEALVEHLVPGRARDARAPSEAELRATRVVRVPLAEASAKVRAGGPTDEPEDLSLPVWAGEIPLRLAAGAPLADAGAPVPVDVPGYAASYTRRRPDA